MAVLSVPLSVPVLYVVVSWLATYAVHSSVLLCGAWILTRLFVCERPAARDLIWKTAVTGSIVTATVAVVSFPGPAQVMRGIFDFQEPTVAASFNENPADTHPEQAGTASAGVADAVAARTIAAGRTSATATSTAFKSASPSMVVGTGTATVVVLFWLAIAGVLLLRQARQRSAFFRRIGARRRIFDGTMFAQLQLLSESCDHDDIDLTTAPRLTSPAVLTANEICVPSEAFTQLEDCEQRSLVSHEFAHVVRRDPLWLRVFHAIERIFFFQPLNRVARMEFEQAAEELCDSWVVDRTGESHALASCLVRVARWMRGEPEVGFVSIAGGPLRSRIERLMSGQAHITPLHPLHPLGLLGALVLVMGVAAWGPNVVIDGPSVHAVDAATADTIVVHFGPDVRYEFGDEGARTTFSGIGTTVFTRRGSISRISRGGRLVVETVTEDRTTAVTVKPSSPRSIAYEYVDDGVSRPFAQQAQEWLSDAILRFVEQHDELDSQQSRLAAIESTRSEDGSLEEVVRQEMLTRLDELRVRDLIDNQSLRADQGLRRDGLPSNDELPRARRLYEQALETYEARGIESSEHARQLLRSREAALADAQEALQSLRYRMQREGVEETSATAADLARFEAGQTQYESEVRPLMEKAAQAQRQLQETMREAQDATTAAARSAVEEARKAGELTLDERLAVREKAAKTAMAIYADAIAAYQAKASAIQQEAEAARSASTSMIQRLYEAQELQPEQSDLRMKRLREQEFFHADELRAREMTIGALRDEIRTLRARLHDLESNQ